MSSSSSRAESSSVLPDSSFLFTAFVVQVAITAAVAVCVFVATCSDASQPVLGGVFVLAAVVLFAALRVGLPRLRPLVAPVEGPFVRFVAPVIVVLSYVASLGWAVPTFLDVVVLSP